jgi:hypothetical protein
MHLNCTVPPTPKRKKGATSAEWHSRAQWFSL